MTCRAARNKTAEAVPAFEKMYRKWVELTHGNLLPGSLCLILKAVCENNNPLIFQHLAAQPEILAEVNTASSHFHKLSEDPAVPTCVPRKGCPADFCHHYTTPTTPKFTNLQPTSCSHFSRTTKIKLSSSLMMNLLGWSGLDASVTPSIGSGTTCFMKG
ncbi:hypothetical protein Pelo_2610 [Pelomyxa schiedti]|nr:hypothetical protein Pelo_2610 [Pelomyxa schiedti]